MRLASETTATPRSRAVVERLEPGGELALAAVDHDQVRQRRERLVVRGVVRAEARAGVSQARMRRVSTSRIAAKSSGSPSASERIVKRR